MTKPIRTPEEAEEFETIRLLRSLPSDEQMDIYTSAFNKLSKTDKEYILRQAEKLQSFRNMGILSSYELLFKLGNYLKWNVEAQI